MRSYKRHSEKKQAEVIAALLEGQAVTKVAKEYKIPYSTVATWKAKFGRGDHIANNKPTVSGLLLQYLETNLDTLREQAAFFADRDWLKKQSASDLAVLHGVMADKTIRILEAYGKHEENVND